MNNAQQTLIDRYRKSGMKYAEIARRMNLPETTVKSYSYRNPLPDDLPGSFCPQCGRPLPVSKFRPRRFCSGACRNKFWTALHADVKGPAGITTVCQYCGKSFQDYKAKNRKYCSHECYISARFKSNSHE